MIKAANVKIIASYAQVSLVAVMSTSAMVLGLYNQPYSMLVEKISLSVVMKLVQTKCSLTALTS